MIFQVLFSLRLGYDFFVLKLQKNFAGVKNGRII